MVGPVRRLLLSCACALAMAATSVPAAASAQGDGPAAPNAATNTPDPAPAGSATTSLSLQGTLDHTLGGAYPGAGPAMPFSSPAVGDLTGDAKPEIVVASMDGRVEAFDAATRARRWTRSLGHTAIQASPTLADLDDDGHLDVVVATMDGRVVWLDGSNGAVHRTYRQGAPLHCPGNTDCRPDGFFATPAVGDVNGDGLLDIVAPSYDHTVYAWSRGGTLLWRRYLEDTLWSSPVIADIDRDHKPEIILGGDIYAGNPLGVPAGGLVWVLRRDGSTYPGYPRSTPGQTVWSSPAVGDLNGDTWPEIVVGTGTNWPDPAGRRVDAFTASNRRNLSGWPVTVDGRVMASPAIGDIDGDGQLEVTFASDGGWVYAYERNGARKWRACNATSASQCKIGYATRAGTVVADVDGDGIQEVVSALDKDVRIFDGKTGAVKAEYRMSHPATYPPGATPVVTSVDGVATIVASTVYRSNGSRGTPQAGDITRVYLLSTGTRLCQTDWPAFMHDSRRRGEWRPGNLSWIPFDCPDDFVRRLYQDFLDRPVEPGGLAYWTARLIGGTSSGWVIRWYLNSPEFGEVVAPALRSYLAVYGTYPPTSATVLDAVDDMRNGATPAEVADAFAAESGPAQLSDEEFVTAVYQHVYKRNPSYLELGADTDKLANGTTRGELASGYAESSIGSDRLAAEVSVAMSYLGMLDRAPDPQGWDYWVAKTEATSIDTLVIGFQRSQEYADRVL